MPSSGSALPLRLGSLSHLAATAVLATAATAQGTFTVGGAAPDFNNVAQALGAAPSGSTLLVRPGVYEQTGNHGVVPHHVIFGKAFTLVATDPTQETRIAPGLDVRNLSADQSVVVLGIDLGGGGPSAGPGLLVEDVLGTVWVQDARVLAPVPFFPGIPLTGGYDAIRATNANAVHLIRVEALASPINSVTPLAPGAGLVVENASVHVFESELVGGRGFSLTLPTGGAAVRVEDGFAYFYRSNLIGGQGGGVGSSAGCTGASGDGGPAVELTSSSAEVVLVATDLTGGAPGSFVAPCTPGSTGPTSTNSGGALTAVSIAPHSLQAPLRASAFVPTPLEIVAPAGTFAWALVAARPDALFVPAKLGIQVVDRTSFETVPIGFVGANGTLRGSLPAVGGAIAPQGDTVFVQPFFFDGGAQQALLATPTAIARTARVPEGKVAQAPTLQAR